MTKHIFNAVGGTRTHFGEKISRRSFLAMSAMAPFAMRGAGATAFRAAPSSTIPVGLELYSVREGLKTDLDGTVKAVAGMGYQCVEFYAPYWEWSEQQTKDVRKLIDDLGVKCYSTHNASTYVSKENIGKTRDRCGILGCKYVVVASTNVEGQGIDGWRKFADVLNEANEGFSTAKMHSGYHNHKTEFVAIDGVRPIEVLAKNTKPTVMLQLDVGTCLEAGGDPVAWIKANPGRIRSLHLKDWSPDAGKGYTVLFGEGVADWRAIFAAAEHGGGVEYYLIEQEGSRMSELDTARECLKTYRKMRA
jgi:sugar phosphate isomerase/epimerase